MPRFPASRNRSLRLIVNEKQNEREIYAQNLLLEDDLFRLFHEKAGRLNFEVLENRIVQADTFRILDLLPDGFADLIFIDPPYNLSKQYHQEKFQQRSDEDYRNWLQSWLPQMQRFLRENGSLYICSDWRSSPLIYQEAKKYFTIQNRITWEREKGRGSKKNWKNNSEDIWFLSKGSGYKFYPDRVKLKKKVLAPYVNDQKQPKDWSDSGEKKYRLTYASNIWTDITVPFWSMRENTDHPTQKPEKLLAKIILASSDAGDVVFDPFAGSGTTAVVAKKLGRSFLGIESQGEYCLLAEKRLALAEKESSIQGYYEGLFWERNSRP